MAWLATHVTEQVAYQAALSAIAAGTAHAIQYTVDSTTADSDPGPGKLRFDNFAAQTSATTLRLDLVDAGSVDFTALLDQLDASTSTVKGNFAIIKLADPTKWIRGNITARAAPSGYRNFTVANLVGSSAAPFANNDSVIFLFTRTGDAGTSATGAITATSLTMATNRLLGRTTASTGAIEEISVAGTLTMSGGVLTGSAAPIIGTPAATTSGTSHDFTGIPSTARRVTVNLNGVSTNGTSIILVQIGDSGGIEATGYSGTTGRITTSSAAGALFGGTGFPLGDSQAAAAIWHGKIVLDLVDAATNTWSASISVARSDIITAVSGAGTKALSATLDRVRLTTTNGTDAFDAGQVNISYE